MGVVVGRATGSARRHSVEPVRPRTPFLARRPVVAAVILAFGVTVAQTIEDEVVVEPAPAVGEAGAAFSLVFAAELIKEHRREHGVLPPDLAAVGLSEAQYRYWPNRDGSFELGAGSGGELVRFDPAGRSQGAEDLLRIMTSSSEGER